MVVWMNSDPGSAEEARIEMSYREYLLEVHRIAFNHAKQLEKELGREQALQVCTRAGDSYGRDLGRRHIAAYGEVHDFEDFKALWRKLITAPMWTNTQQCEIVHEGPNELRMKVTRCLWAETFKELGDLELGYAMCCHPDHQMIKAYHPRLRLERTKSIMKGDDHCNHIFIWE